MTYTYDALYRLKTLKDGKNNMTTYGYDSIGHVSNVQMPGGESVQFPSYDAAGHLLQRIDGNNVTTNYLYNDAENQLTDIQYPATPGLNVHFGYDGYGRRNAMTDATGSQSYTYGNRDEMLSHTTTYGGGMDAQTISYVYYPDGSRQTMTTPAGNFAYAYDGAGRMTSLVNPYSETTSWTYFNNNWLHTQRLNNNVLTSYAYNAAGQLAGLSSMRFSALRSDFSQLIYDGAGNRTGLTASLPAAPSLERATTYQYDQKDQLTQEETAQENGGFTDGFAYDAAGNPTTFRGATKIYNANNQQTGTGFTHDNNGNPTTYNGTTLTFDPENRLTAYGTTLTAGYTGDGLRAWKRPANRSTTYFLYDGTLPIIELDKEGGVLAVNTFGAAGLVSRWTGASTFYTFDPQGSVAQRLDASGAVVSSHQFAAHGAEVTTPSADPFGYGAQWGYYSDRETGLQLLTNRYYDPSAGRFLTRDPIGYRGGVNLYAYVGNSPTNGIDPSGLLIVHIWHASDGWGHTSITLDDGTHISWWPSPDGRVSKFGHGSLRDIYTAPANRNQTLERDVELEERWPDENIRIDGLDEEKIKKWWEDFKEKNKWSSLTQNCSTTVADALMAGGAPTGHFPVWRPKEIADYAKYIQKHLHDPPLRRLTFSDK
ncbi:MAG: RHS repeat-associated core domain-containing protein [Pyrinomonadaceae bacterium]